MHHPPPSDPTRVSVHFENNFDGLIHHLGLSAGSSSSPTGRCVWKNPADTTVSVTASSTTRGQANLLLAPDYSCHIFSTKDDPGSWVALQFLHHHVKPSAYSLAHSAQAPHHYLRSWVFEASVNMQVWEALSVHTEDCTLSRAQPQALFVVQGAPRYWRAFRVRIAGRGNTSRTHVLSLSRVEVFGTMKPADPPPNPPAEDALTLLFRGLIGVSQEAVQGYLAAHGAHCTVELRPGLQALAHGVPPEAAQRLLPSGLKGGVVEIEGVPVSVELFQGTSPAPAPRPAPAVRRPTANGSLVEGERHLKPEPPADLPTPWPAEAAEPEATPHRAPPRATSHHAAPHWAPGAFGPLLYPASPPPLPPVGRRWAALSALPQYPSPLYPPSPLWPFAQWYPLGVPFAPGLPPGLGAAFNAHFGALPPRLPSQQLASLLASLKQAGPTDPRGPVMYDMEEGGEEGAEEEAEEEAEEGGEEEGGEGPRYLDTYSGPSIDASDASRPPSSRQSSSAPPSVHSPPPPQPPSPRVPTPPRVPGACSPVQPRSPLSCAADLLTGERFVFAGLGADWA